MAKRWKLSEDEAQMILDYREGLKAKSEEKTESKEETKEENNSKEEKNMDGKKILKGVGIGTAIAAAVGVIGYGIYKTFFETDPLDDFDEEFDDEADDEDDDLFEDDAADNTDQESGSNEETSKA